MNTNEQIRKGNRVRDRIWGGKHEGTVTGIRTIKGIRYARILWDNTSFEDEQETNDIKMIYGQLRDPQGPRCRSCKKPLGQIFFGTPGLHPECGGGVWRANTTALKSFAAEKNTRGASK